MRILYSFILALGLILAAQPVLAAGGGGGSSWSSEEKADPNFTAGTEAIEAKNRADSVIYETEKAMNEHKAQLDKTEVEKIETTIKELQELCAKDENDLSADEIKAKTDEVQQQSLKVFEMVYKQVCFS